MDIHAFLMGVVYLLVIVGALNWGLVGLFGMDLVARIFGPGSVMARVVYVLVGLSAVILLVKHFVHM